MFFPSVSTSGAVGDQGDMIPLPMTEVMSPDWTSPRSVPLAEAALFAVTPKRRSDRRVRAL
jgi:hypothetical protein